MKSWYSIQAKAATAVTEISIFDEIGYFGVSAKQFIGDLKSVPSNHKILLRIHSPGGEVFDGNAIANALKRHVGGYEVQIEGLAASMATVISLGGSPVKMSANGFYMIHNPWGMAMGDADNMRDQAELLDKIQTGIVNAYAARSGKSIQQIEDWMDAETWFTAEEALAAGFIDEITDAVKIAACTNGLGKFKNAPQNLTMKETDMDIAPAPTEEITPAIVAEEIATPEVTPEPAAEVVTETPVATLANTDSILAKVNAISGERDAYKALADSYKAKIDATELALDRLERSLGVAAAKVVPAVEPLDSSSLCVTRQQFDAMNTIAQNEFFRNGGKLTQ